jgi:nitrogen regulatory protein PII
MKRVDLIFSERELEAVLQAIDRAGCSGYTVIKQVTGKGPRGTVSESLAFSGVGANAHVVVFCRPDLLAPLRDGVRPLLNRYGGVGFVSDAEPL